MNYDEIIKKLEEAERLDLHKVIGNRSDWWNITESKDPVGAVNARILAESVGDDSTRAAYLRLRDQVKAFLRGAQRLQRARKAADLAVSQNKESNRASTMSRRMSQRCHITRLIALRHAIRDWARADYAARHNS